MNQVKALVALVVLLAAGLFFPGSASAEWVKQGQGRWVWNTTAGHYLATWTGYGWHYLWYPAKDYVNSDNSRHHTLVIVNEQPTAIQGDTVYGLSSLYAEVDLGLLIELQDRYDRYGNERHQRLSGLASEALEAQRILAAGQANAALLQAGQKVSIERNYHIGGEGPVAVERGGLGAWNKCLRCHGGEAKSGGGVALPEDLSGIGPEQRAVLRYRLTTLDREKNMAVRARLSDEEQQELLEFLCN